MPIEGGDEYQSYLLRMWRDADSAPWRASLQVVTTGRVYAFADLEALFRFIAKRARRPSLPGPQADHEQEG